MTTSDLWRQGLNLYIKKYEERYAQELADTQPLPTGTHVVLYGPHFDLFWDKVVLDYTESA